MEQKRGKVFFSFAKKVLNWFGTFFCVVVVLGVAVGGFVFVNNVLIGQPSEADTGECKAIINMIRGNEVITNLPGKYDVRFNSPIIIINYTNMFKSGVHSYEYSTKNNIGDWNENMTMRVFGVAICGIVVDALLWGVYELFKYIFITIHSFYIEAKKGT
jgi:hypothetical protein